MNTLAKLIAPIAAMITSLAFAWIAKDGSSIRARFPFVSALARACCQDF
jgi:hypothetical protein